MTPARAPVVSARLRDAVQDSLHEGLRGGIFPGAVAAVARGRAPAVLGAVGHAQVTPRRRAITVDTIFDLASLTKPLATTTAVLQLWARGVIDLDAPVAAYLPGFAQGAKAAVTIRHLLTHTSGLPAWEMLYLPGPTQAGGTQAAACHSIEDAVARICATPAQATPGSMVEYSDLGFIILGHLVERLSGERFAAYADRHIARPLGLRWTRFAPPRSWRTRCAATEAGNAYERARAAEQGLGRSFRWRNTVICGEVHDGNAWYLGRGVAGHAGVFATAADVVRFGTALLQGAEDPAGVLPAAVIAEATRLQTPGGGAGGRGLGWALGQPFMGKRASPAAFGHTGFTGTSLLVDPGHDAVIVLLTNRVHPAAVPGEIEKFRPAFHDAVFEALGG